ncbi:MAG: hypothetical protein SGCHY_000957 [Lobulomycetales sp.]
MFRVGRTRTLSRQQVACNRWLARILLAVLLLGVPVWVAWIESSRHELALASTEALSTVVPLHNLEGAPAVSPGSLVHASVASVSSEPVLDPDMGVVFSESLRVQRNTEYCQWQEHSTSHVVQSADEETGQEEIVQVTYYYTKGWTNAPILSLFYDQPAAHHNPQFDPVPSASFSAREASLNSPSGRPVLRVLSSLLEHARPLQRVQALSPMPFSFHSFRSIGGGYLYYSHESSMFERFLRGIGMTLESSLLDFQLGDLFSQCNAGDIRISYSAVPTARGLSVLAGVGPDARTLDTHRTTRGFPIAILRSPAGLSVEEMLALERADMRWWVLGAQGVLFLWTFPVVNLLLAPAERGPREPGTWIPTLVSAGMSVCFWIAAAEAIRGVVQESVSVYRATAILISLAVLYLIDRWWTARNTRPHGPGREKTE